MYRKINSDSDTYIVDRVIKGQRKYNSNTGRAGTLDLFTLYGVTTSGSNPNNELSRILLHFNTSDLLTDVQAGKIDISNRSFNCTLHLYDVYGGQPTPSAFTVKAYPLSMSFDEGLGRDVVFYQDTDIANFYTASFSSGSPQLWHASGANGKGYLGSSDIDVISSGNLGAGTVNLAVTQSFPFGTEHLALDVTQHVSATLCGLLPDCGFRVSFTESQEQDGRTRFVKRFGSSNCLDPYSRPSLVVRYDDSVVSNAENITFDSNGTIFLYNYVRGNLTNVVSGTALTPITGANCLLLKLVTPMSTSNGFVNVETFFTGSQHTIGGHAVTGIYSASVLLASANTNFATRLQQSGSLTFDQVWCSLDKTIAYFSGSLEVDPVSSETGPIAPRRYYLNVTNIATEYISTDTARMKVFIYDFSRPVVKLVKIPIETPSVVVEHAFYSIRDVSNDKIIIPFDTTYNSTRLSADSSTMYFDLLVSSLIPGRSYVIDIMLIEGGQQQIYRDVSPAFRVVEV